MHMLVFTSGNIDFYYMETFFTDHLKTAIVSSDYLDYDIVGSSSSRIKKLGILSAIGEFLEREWLYFDNKTSMSNEVKGFSLVDKKVLSINKEELYKKNLFSDSCGMSSHTSSQECLINSFCEFVERQSYIYTYLSKTNGYKIDIDVVKKNVKLPHIYEKLKFYEISLVESFSVILGLGIINNEVMIGLGGGFSLKESLEHCIKEINQSYFNMVLFSQYVGSRNDCLKKDKKNKDYIDVFKGISVESVLKAYEFLNEFPLYEEKSYDKSYDIEIVSRDLYNKCRINPIVIFMQHPRKNLNIKMCKVFDKNWFPMLLPKGYSNDTYEFVEKVMNCKLDRNCTFLPFP